MRGRASFALTAFLLLFLLQALSVLLATLYSTAHDALYPVFRPLLLLPAVLPAAALLAPSTGLTRLHDRHGAIAAAAIVCALARVPLSLPHHWLRFGSACVILAAGAVFLTHASGYIERRRLAGGLAAAITADQLLRLAGWSWDLSLRTWWVLPQAALSGIVILLALAWRGMPDPHRHDRHGVLERRAGGLRLRGGIALALILFIDLHFLARAEVAAHWLGVRYEVVATTLVGAGAAATLLLLAGHGPIGARRRSAGVLTLLCAGAVLIAPTMRGTAGLVAFAAGHVAALLLLGRVLAPAGGRRPGRNVSLTLGTWLLASALYTFTFFPAFTLPFMRNALPVLLGAAGLLLFPLLMLLPRPLETQPPLRGRVVIGGTLFVALAAAVALALRQRALPLTADAGDVLRVATWNVHHGFGENRRFDPARIAGHIAVSSADVIALQEVGAGLPTAYGVDLVLYLSRKLRIPAQFAPTHNGTMGDALLHRVGVGSPTSVALPPADIDDRQVSRFDIALARAHVQLFVTRLGLSDAEQQAQAAALADLIRPLVGPVVLVGDLNAGPGSSTLRRLGAIGLEDAFALAGRPAAATAPAHTPTRRIDWILVRGLDVEAAAVTDDGGSDHRMVTATLRLR